jgi:iron complex transport system substrate-binding protein
MEDETHMKKRFLTALLSLTLAGSVFAFGASASQDEAESETVEVSQTTEAASDNETSYPMTISHYYGETVIEEKPERIVTLGWENQDTPLALGVAPVGCSASNYGLATENNLHPWSDEAFAALGVTEPNVFNDTDGFDYEAIADAQPDVILAAYSGMTEEEYNRLSEIAPVVPFQTGAWQTTWREQTLLNAEGMGMLEEGEAKVAEVEALIEEKLAKYPDLAGKNTAFFWIDETDFSVFYAYLPTDPRANFLLDLGLNIPDSILGLSDDEEAFSVTISHENANLLNDVDIMVVYGNESLVEALQADPLMSTIPAVSNGAIVLIDAETELAAATTPSILSIPACIDDYLALLSEANEKIQ